MCAFYLTGLLQMKSGFDWLKYFPDYSDFTNGYPTGTFIEHIYYAFWAFLSSLILDQLEENLNYILALKSYVLMWTFFYGLIHIY